MKPFASKAHAPLLAAIRRMLAPGCSERCGADGDGPEVVVESVRAEDWQSLTFEGQKHWLDLRLDGTPGAVAAARDRLTAVLDGGEFELAGHVVADIALVSSAQLCTAGRASCRLHVEALTIVD